MIPATWLQEYRIFIEFFYILEADVQKLPFFIEFIDFWDRDGHWADDNWIMDPIFRHGTPYDGDDDWYEFDSDEFNYSYYRLTNNQVTRFNEILKSVGSNERVENFEDSMTGLLQEFKYPKIQSKFDDLINEYLNVLGYVIQKNRWLSVSWRFDDISNKLGADTLKQYGCTL